MKPTKLQFFISIRQIQFLIGLGFISILIVSLLLPFIFKSIITQQQEDELISTIGLLNHLHSQQEIIQFPKPLPNSKFLSTLNYDIINGNPNSSSTDGFGAIQRSAMEAFSIGKKFWEELELLQSDEFDIEFRSKKKKNETTREICPNLVTLSSGCVFEKRGSMIVLPCGMTFGSHVTVVGRPRHAHLEQNPRISLLKPGQKNVMVSQFMMELQGLKTVDGEEPPRILHFNPRLKGDWSGKPMIEMNTCYRMQWGLAQRCEGWKSRVDEETVDGQVKCEKWMRDDDNSSEETKTSWWLNRMIGRTKKVAYDWPFPFTEGKLFVLTLSAGMEGYHVNVDGRHITSFPYRTGFALEDATGLILKGDVDVNAIFAGSLPSTHPSFAPQRNLEMSGKWKTRPLPISQSIYSLAFFQQETILPNGWPSGSHGCSTNSSSRHKPLLDFLKEVNAELKKEAEFFGDIVIVPYMDNYDLVVLKTVAICEYGVHTASAKYIMKCDDDTFVRVDAVLTEANKNDKHKSLYLGNINYYHKPLRYGKWAVTYEEWPEEDYPPYANGPGYILSSDIAKFIALEFKKHTLKLFKMEDVSMGMWVEQFNKTKHVEYVHSLKFCQFGCIQDYYTAHYQSPRQMLCMWNKLHLQGRIECCNMR
ncbi:hypothetical protein OSB04_005357 [Centaurea solstitialis]|uniref:Galectin domain-containing protein n=1 Tax=Centaurea solstitialis TaxID=347529 RepID=A0AA38WGD6_9ASTR|nr:hypothetical protein OSB04_005357 [Centaurea solstitialis]